MDIAAQLSTYFASAPDATLIGEAVPHTSSGNTVTPLIDGHRYFRAIRALLESMGQGPNVSKQFFYVTGWWLDFTDGSTSPVVTSLEPAPGKPPVSATTRSFTSSPAFRLEDDIHPSPGPLMSELLAKRAAEGVDVRVMAWVNPAMLLDSVVSKGVGTLWEVAAENLLSIEHLRGLSVGGVKPLAKSVNALTIPHPIGAAHFKVVLAHDGTKLWAFVGGIDFQASRISGEMHPSSSEFWHDVAVAVDGPATQAIYDTYRNLWNEQISRPKASFLLSGRKVQGVESGTTMVPNRTFPNTGTTGKHHVQVATTFPQYKFGFFAKGWAHGTTPLSFAPNGMFGVKVAWKKAIDSATKYIYIEDQSFFSQDVMQWINLRLRTNPDVKVILLSGIDDPVDTPVSGPMGNAINNHLLDSLDAAQKARIGFFKRNNVFVHSKATIIDDRWLFVGSANHMRRSLFTDFEMSIATLDEDEELAREFRVNLWGGHFGKLPSQRAALNDLNGALAVWRSSWSITTSPPFSLSSISAFVDEIALPVTTDPFDLKEKDLVDGDSRKVLKLEDLK